MTDLEKIEDLHSELKFWHIYVDNPHYHGSIDGNDVYINAYQPNIDWLITALHETAHFENDVGDFSNGRNMQTMVAEKWATYEADQEFKKMFG